METDCTRMCLLVPVGTTALFLYNYSSKALEGVVVAVDRPQLNLEPEAWINLKRHRSGVIRKSRNAWSHFCSFVCVE